MAIVKSIEHFSITITTTNPVSVNLTKGQTIADCVPIITLNLASLSGNIRRRFFDVEFEAGPKITFTRDQATGTVVIEGYVKEYDTTDNVSVQSGVYAMAATEATDTVNIDTDVTDADRALCVAYNSCDNNGGLSQAAHCSVVFNSTTQLLFTRGNTSDTVAGHYFIVWTTGTEFAVDHEAITVGTNDETNTGTIGAVTLDNTFVYHTLHITGAAGGRTRDFGLALDMSATTTVRSRRAFNDFAVDDGAANAGVEIKAQVVECAGTEWDVQRGEIDWGDALTATANINAIDEDKAVILPGGILGVLSSQETNGAETDGNYANYKYTSTTVVTGTRGTNTDPDGTSMFESIEFELAGEEGSVIANPILQFDPEWHTRHVIG